MKILYDTSILVASIVADHPKHDLCYQHFSNGLLGDHKIYVCTHSIAETYSTLTKTLMKPRISPGAARQIIRDNIISKCNIVQLDQQDYENALDFSVDRGLSGATIYDILIFQSFKKVKANKIATLNVRHFTPFFDDNFNHILSF